MRYLSYVAAAALSMLVVHCTAPAQEDAFAHAKANSTQGSKSKSSSGGGDDDDSTGSSADGGTALKPRPDPILDFTFNADDGSLHAKIMANVASGASLKVSVFAIDNGAAQAIDCSTAAAVDLSGATTSGKYVVVSVPADANFLSRRLDGTTRTAIQGCLSDSTGKSVVQMQTSLLNAWDNDDTQAAAVPRIYHGIAAYTAGCMAEMGELPMFANGDFNCTTDPGMHVLPIHATASDGTVTTLDETTTNFPLTSAQQAATKRCDTPAWLGYEGDAPNTTQCAPFTRIGQYQNSQGTRFMAICRRETVRALNDPTFENINFVAHNPTTGKTCYFNNHLDSTSTNGTAVPTPDGTATDQFWMDMGSIQGQRCPSCHDSDPWIHSPWVDSAIDKTTGHTIVPRIGDDPAYTLTTKYSIFGRESFLGTDQQSQIDWQQPQQLMNVGSCGNCHRIGTGMTMQFWTDRSVGLTNDLSSSLTPAFSTTAKLQWMPMDQASVQLIDNCARNPSGCTIQDVPH